MDFNNDVLIYCFRLCRQLHINNLPFQRLTIKDVRLNQFLISDFAIIVINDNLTINWLSDFISRPKNNFKQIRIISQRFH